MAIVTRDQIYTPQNTLKFLCLIHELKPFYQEEPAIFTIRDEKEGYISLKKLFVRYVSEDPTESLFAEEVFGDVGYWLKVRDKDQIKPLVEEWTKEADVIRKQKAFRAILKEVEKDGKASFTAAKFLIEEPWKNRKSSTVRKQINETTEAAARKVKEDYSEDWERLKETGVVQ